MEPKVIQASLAAARRHREWGFSSASTVSAQSGSANNWAFGFNVHGPKHAERVVDAVRRELERADRAEGLLLLQSMAGGTGSGFGSYATHALKDAFGGGCEVASVGVWPHETGEVMVQHYNTLLSLAHAAEDVDALLLVPNDEIAGLCRRRLGLAHVSFRHMNDAIAGRLAPFLLPSAPAGDAAAAGDAWARCGATPCALRSPLRSVLADTASRTHPVLSARVTPVMASSVKAFSTHTWDGLTRHLRQMHALGTGVDETLNWRVDLDAPARNQARYSNVTRCVAATAVFRGQRSAEVDTSRFATPHVFHNQEKLFVRSSPHAIGAYDKSAAILSNDDSFLPPLERLSTRAHSMLQVKAFTHHYDRYGVDMEWFNDALLHTERLVHAYRDGSEKREVSTSDHKDRA